MKYIFFIVLLCGCSTISPERVRVSPSCEVQMQSTQAPIYKPRVQMDLDWALGQKKATEPIPVA